MKKNAKDEGLSMGEYLQWKNLFILEETIFENLKSGAKERTLSMQNSIATIYFQAETAETMLKVEGRLQEVGSQQKLTTNILKKVEKNTSTWRQFGLVVAASFFGGALVLFLGKWLGLS